MAMRVCFLRHAGLSGMLTDDPVAVAVGNNILDPLLLVSGENHEVRLVATNVLVGGKRQADLFRAVIVAAFTEEVGLARLRSLSPRVPLPHDFLDPVVDVAEQTLVVSNATVSAHVQQLSLPDLAG